MTPEPAKSSDQLPEEGPPEVVGDDDSAPEGAAREAAREHARGANRSDHQPGDARETQTADVPAR